jgi:hypothetical protein
VQFFIKVNHTDCEIITFEVEKKDFSLVPSRDKIIAFGTNFLKCSVLGFSTISM